MGKRCGKPKPPKDQDLPKDTTKDIGVTTTQTQNQTQKTNPVDQPPNDDGAKDSNINIQSGLSHESSQRSRRKSLSKMIVQSSINLANKMNAGVFTALTSMEDIRRRYRFEAKIYGSGKFGNVRVARLISNPNKKYAIKTISKEKLGDDKLLLMREVDIFTALDHPNIVTFYENYQDEQYFHFVMEFCSGGELLDRIAKEGYLTEEDTKRIMGQAFSAVHYIHEKGIVHRDLKLENFLFENEKPDSPIKLIDFGLAKRYEPARHNLRTMLGTPYYVAPEVLTGKYNEKCDEWSLGVMMYIMLSGDPPFDGEDDPGIFKAIAKAQFSLDGEYFTHVSLEAKDLLRKLLEKNVDQRISAVQALEHPWFKTNTVSKTKNIEQYQNVIKNLTRFEKQNKFKREVMGLMVNQLREDDLNKLKEAFQYFDKTGTGEITISELKQVMSEQGLSYTNEEIQKIVKNVQLEEKDHIRYHEFLTAAMDVKVYTNKDMLWMAFKFFDVENKSGISIKNIKDVMARAGKILTEEDTQEMTKELDVLRDGRLTFEQFCKMMSENRIDHTDKVSPAEFNHDVQWSDEIAVEKDRNINDVKIQSYNQRKP